MSSLWEEEKESKVTRPTVINNMYEHATETIMRGNILAKREYEPDYIFVLGENVWVAKGEEEAIPNYDPDFGLFTVTEEKCTFQVYLDHDNVWWVVARDSYGHRVTSIQSVEEASKRVNQNPET